MKIEWKEPRFFDPPVINWTRFPKFKPHLLQLVHRTRDEDPSLLPDFDILLFYWRAKGAKVSISIYLLSKWSKMFTALSSRIHCFLFLFSSRSLLAWKERKVFQVQTMPIFNPLTCVTRFKSIETVACHNSTKWSLVLKVNPNPQRNRIVWKSMRKRPYFSFDLLPFANIVKHFHEPQFMVSRLLQHSIMFIQ